MGLQSKPTKEVLAHTIECMEENLRTLDPGADPYVNKCCTDYYQARIAKARKQLASLSEAELS